MSDARTGDEGNRITALARAWEILVQRAREGRTISYGEMAAAMVLSPQSGEFTETIKELSRSEEAAGRGLLGVIVVRKRQATPGASFFDLARELGRQFTNEKVFFLEESERVFAQWQGRPAEELDVLHDHIIEELEQFYFATHEGEADRPQEPSATASAARRSSSPASAPTSLLGRVTWGVGWVAAGFVSVIRAAFRRDTRQP